MGNTYKAGNMVVIGADRDALRALAEKKDLDEHCVMNKKSHVTSKIQFKDGLFVYPIWIKRPKDKNGASKTNVAAVEKDAEGFWTPF